ncbi:hypothetical protein AYW79_10060 [Ferroacidibacillus organovorans]|uniref:Membrane insertase YidC/Oxa/ALB C-terminal domain-containing protein n=2 Tax=Ferroacidibacillus organovorans TaxID=1765683 RepID=A0A162TGL0_9BACL|nr:hypothetical protein AYJ22_09905 [Ferroacidibacillus organovorans]OAG93565.1 hypothetical protein AYW79_10060 [Ferroacidibacillus organovorans]OPG16817.1 hypothetical protein B2M26_04770 [Ferroacidibacillus organovorans]
MKMRGMGFFVRKGSIVFGLGSLIWVSMAVPAFAATAHPAASTPIWDQAINGLSDVINFFGRTFNGDYGLALLLVTFLIRMLTVPLMLRSLRNTKKMQLLQPQLTEIKNKYAKSDPKRYQEEMMGLYKSEGVNPVAGCMPMLLQLVILTILYRSIYTDPALIHSKFLGILALGKPDPTFILPVLAAVTSFFQQKMSMVQLDPSQRMIMYIFPVMIFFMSLKAFAALALYWVFSNIFTIVQMYFTRVRPSKSGA